MSSQLSLRSDDLEYDGRYRTCAGCGKLLPREAFMPRALDCVLCQGEKGKERVMRRVSAASQQLARAIGEARERYSPDTPEILNAFKETIGGAAALGRMIAEDMQRIREQPPQMRPEGVLQRYYQVMVRAFARNDEHQEAIDLTSFTEGELRDIVAAVAVELLRDDPQFRRRVAQAAGLRLEEPIEAEGRLVARSGAPSEGAEGDDAR